MNPNGDDTLSGEAGRETVRETTSPCMFIHDLHVRCFFSPTQTLLIDLCIYICILYYFICVFGNCLVKPL